MVDPVVGELLFPPRSGWEPVGLDSITTTREPTPEPPPAPQDTSIGRIFGGKYLVLDRLGSGGMAVVYRAQEQGMLRREVAIKVLTPESALSQATIARFLKEAQAIANLNHTNVVQVIELGRTDDGQIYLVMERLLGKTLHEILKEMVARNEVFTWERLAPLVLQLCRALLAAHRQGIIHRDIKPSNCFCCDLDEEQWHLKVLDFGIAKVQRSDASIDSIETPLTREGMFLGTPHYAAPESIQRRPADVIDGRVDIFAVGVMMYHCMTGTLPFQRTSGPLDPVAVMYKTANETPQPPRERAPHRNISPEVEAIILKAMHRDPEQRYRTVSDLIEAIRTLFRRTGVILEGSATIIDRNPVESAIPRSASVPGGISAVTTTEGAPIPVNAPGGASTATALVKGAPIPANVSGISPATAVEGTPIPPSLFPQESPTLGPANTRSAAIALAVLAALLCGVVVLVVLVLRDIRNPQPTNPSPLRPPAPMARDPARLRPAPREPTKPVSERPARAVDTKPAEAVSAESTTPGDVRAHVEPDVPAEGAAPLPGPETTAPQPPTPVDPPKSAKPDVTASRNRTIKTRLDAIAREKSTVKCLPLSIDFADGVFDELPVMLTVDAEGNAQASVGSQKVARRVPASAESCIFDILRVTRFPAGTSTIKVPHVLRFD